ncbi:hypothetical protein [Nevskia soli]|jgi:hypothetical protein|uniref:hypothetical protein n=1 Tax=Nevskia soli TaxID=418856 RepID=UPI0015D8B3C7|nr:hypothetical protein [Nevskia soli]
MADHAGTLIQLDLVRKLLINPTTSSMQECQRLLGIVISAVSKRPGDAPSRAEIRNALRPIQFLLNSASAFWAGRQLSTLPPQTYTPEGRLLPAPSSGSVSVEV